MVDHLGMGMTMLDVVHDVPDLGGSTMTLAKWIIDLARLSPARSAAGSAGNSH